MRISFASDNTAGAHPKVLAAIAGAQSAPWASAYGSDPLTENAEAKLREVFGGNCDAFLVFNGTGANVLALSALLRPYECVICPDSAHLQVDECGALERFSGAKVIPVPSPDGKLRPEQLKPWLAWKGDVHRVQPKVVSISQPTELGTLYSPEELRSLADFAHENGILLHMDGARFGNAVAAQSLTLRAASADLGIDALSFGGTKNGLAFGEAVVFFGERTRSARADFPFHRKQGLQLASKMRFLAAQFLAYLDGDLWLRNASHANAMAARLAAAVRDADGLEIAQSVQANAVFARLPSATIEKLQKDFYFYVWDPATRVVRWMCSFETRPEDVDAFAAAIRRELK